MGRRITSTPFLVLFVVLGAVGITSAYAGFETIVGGDLLVSGGVFSSQPFVFKMRKNLRDFRDKDYILLTGDPAIIGISSAIVSDNTNGVFNLLKWDRREAKYYPIAFDLNQKG